MDYFHSLRKRIRVYLALFIFAENILLLGIIWYASGRFGLQLKPLLIRVGGASIVLASIFAFVAAGFILQPLEAIWRAILQITQHNNQTASPNFKKLAVGRTLVTRLMEQVYQIISETEHPESSAATSFELKNNFVANYLPLPLLVLDPGQAILFANHAACDYLGRPADDITGQSLSSILHMSFPSDETLEAWLKKTEGSAVTASTIWERVRLDVTDTQPTRLFDMAAFYNKDNPSKCETILVLFDHTKRYSQDDQAISFMALSVHELRTPLALLRGYIEALEEETHNGKLNPELQDFIAKMSATAQQMMAYVNTMLNVARVDNNQLVLKLHEENWGTVVKAAVDMMTLRARVRGITLNLRVADGLPTVGIDRTSIQEVISNLLDNAIKYSGQSKEITVNTYVNGEGLVETAVQDSGVGIPASILPNLFTKFYRDHRNRAQIGGTGLGLYLCKAVVTAHGGNIWVTSKEGKGSVFSFTVIPYARLAENARNGDNKEITRSPHGWIKNHSLYRR